MDDSAEPKVLDLSEREGARLVVAFYMFASGFSGNEPKKAFRTLYEMIKALVVAIGGWGKLAANGMDSMKVDLLTESENWTTECSSEFSVISTGGNIT